MRNVEFNISLRGQDIQVKATVAPAETDVGIMSDYIDDYELFGENGVALDWDLTDEERGELDEKGCELAYEQASEAYTDDDAEEF